MYDRPVEIKSVDKMEKSISYVRIEPAKNGAIVSYDKKVKPEGSGTYDNYMFKPCKEVFEAKGNMTKDMAIQKAFDRFQELWREEYDVDNEEMESEEE